MAKRSSGTPRTMDEWRALARHLGQPAQYSINLTGSGEYKVERHRHYNPETRKSEMIEERKLRTYAEHDRVMKDAGTALKDVAKQDPGHASVAARHHAMVAPEVVDARAHVLKYDYERYHLRRILRSPRGRYRRGVFVKEGPSDEQRARMATRVRELDGLVARYANEQKAAYEKAYAREKKKEPKAPRTAAPKAAAKPYTVGSYTPEKVSIAEIAGARRNPRVLQLERAAADLRRVGTRERATKAAEAYHRARDKEIAKIRAEGASGASSSATPRSGTVSTRARASAKGKHLSSQRTDAYVGGALHRAHEEKQKAAAPKKPRASRKKKAS